MEFQLFPCHLQFTCPFEHLRGLANPERYRCMLYTYPHLGHMKH